jgi:hypothetical protein
VDEEHEQSKVPQGLGQPGMNPLFFAMLSGLALGVLAGLAAGDGAPAAALRSNLVFRIEVGAIAAIAAYWAAAALWLSWHRTLFARMGVGGAGVESPGQKQAVIERDTKVEEFMSRTTETLDDLVGRVELLESERDLQEKARGSQ